MCGGAGADVRRAASADVDRRDCGRLPVLIFRRRRPLLIFRRRWEDFGQASLAELAGAFIFLNLSVVVARRRWCMRAWHCCLMALGERQSVEFKRAWARGPLFVLHRRSLRMSLRVF
jgi:hypothetical protein